MHLKSASQEANALPTITQNETVMAMNRLIDLGKVSEETKGMHLGSEGPLNPFYGDEI
jgi:hypothetical protein